MKFYETPLLKIMEFSGKDVVCTSGEDGFVSTTNTNDNDFSWGWTE